MFMGHITERHSKTRLQAYTEACYAEALKSGAYTKADGDLKQFLEDLGSILRASCLAGRSPEAFVFEYC